MGSIVTDTAIGVNLKLRLTGNRFLPLPASSDQKHLQEYTRGELYETPEQHTHILPRR